MVSDEGKGFRVWGLGSGRQVRAESDCVNSDRSQHGHHLCSLPMRPGRGEGTQVTRETA